MSFDNLSVQIGTSVKVLEQHYSHFKVSDDPNRFAGHELRAIYRVVVEYIFIWLKIIIRLAFHIDIFEEKLAIIMEGLWQKY